MNHQLITLDVISKTKSLAELRELVRIEGSDGSHDAGDIRRRDELWGSSRLTVDADLPETASAEEQILALRARVPRFTAPEDVQVILTIAHFFDYSGASFQIPLHALCEAHFGAATIDVVSYPCAESGKMRWP